MLVLQVLAWVALLIVAGSQVARHLTVARQPIIIVATLAPYFSFVGVVSLILFAVAGSLIGVLLASAAVVWVLASAARPFLGRRVAPSGPPSLTVLTSNAFLGLADAEGVLAAIRSSEADLVALQEIPAELLEELQRLGIDDLLPHCVLAPAPLWAGAALWSRYPLRDARVEVVDQLYRVAAVAGVHPDDPERDPYVASLHIHAPWPPAPEPWVRQLAELGDELATIEHPVIAMGDFNATLDHAPFRALLRTGLFDAAVSVRAWPAFTYPGNRAMPALIAIDHVLTRGLVATSLQTLPIKGSDHHAIVARLADC